MSATSVPLENWGQLKMRTTKSEDGSSAAGETFVELVSMPKGKEKGSAAFAPHNIVSVPVSAIASASGTTKNDISMSLRQSASAAGGLELTSLRLAVPDMCIGYEQTEEAGKVILGELQNSMRAYQARFLKSTKGGSEEDNLLALANMGSGAAKRKDEAVVGTFDDVNLSYPAGKYKIVISNYNVVLEDKRKGAAGGGLVSFPLSDVLQLYLCDVPAYFGRAAGDVADVIAQYLVLILKTPLKIRNTSYANVVISCPTDLVLDETHPWRCELKTQEEINKVLGFAKMENEAEYPLVPAMSGRVSDILLRTFKAVAKVSAFGGKNKDYSTVLTQSTQSCMRCLFHGGEGLLYVVTGGLLYLHRPATRIAYKDVERVTLDESESGSATFQITVYASTDKGKGKDKYVFSGMDKLEKEGLITYLRTKAKVDLIGLVADDDDDEEDDEDASEDDDEESDEDNFDSDDDDEDFDSDDDSDDGGKKKKSEKKPKKEKKSRKRDRGEETEEERRQRKKEKKERKERKKKENINRK